LFALLYFLNREAGEEDSDSCSFWNRRSFLEPRCNVSKTIAAKRPWQRFASVAIAVAGIVAVAAGCARTPYYTDSLPGGAAVTRPNSTAFNPSTSKGWNSVPWVGTDSGYDPQASRLQSRERMIEGRITTIDRKLDIIDMRRWQRRHTEPLRRYRPGPREVLLQRENRNLQSQQRFLSRELNRLEFERRIGRSTPDPFADPRRFPSPSILER
jgi:hypothetical protein